MNVSHVDHGRFCQALGSVFVRNRNRWLTYLASFLNSPGDADDVLQEAVWRVLARRRSFSSEDQLRMYLARAISNKAIEFYHLRKKERIRRRPLDAGACADPVRGNPEDALERIEQDRRRERARCLLRAGLSRLPPKQYEALCLTYLSPEDSSIREAGVNRGIPYSTLRHRSIQGLRQLRSYVCKGLDCRHQEDSSDSVSATP